MISIVTAFVVIEDVQDILARDNVISALWRRVRINRITAFEFPEFDLILQRCTPSCRAAERLGFPLFFFENRDFCLEKG